MKILVLTGVVLFGYAAVSHMSNVDDCEQLAELHSVIMEDRMYDVPKQELYDLWDGAELTAGQREVVHAAIEKAYSGPYVEPKKYGQEALTQCLHSNALWRIL